MLKVYIAAPLFSTAERVFNGLLKERLSPYFSVYLPQEDGELLVDVVARGEDPEKAKVRIFHSDLEAIRAADLLLIVLDGRVPDEGACFELGVAYSLGKRCIGLQTDPRRLITAGNNPMLAGAISQIFSSVDDLIEWVSSMAF